MANTDERRTEEGFHRLVTFADAVVAIALTLLVLPLADIVPEVHEDTGVWDLLVENRIAIQSFLISFAVIWVLWHHHHQLMEYFRAYDRTFFSLTFIWLLTIVLLPFATALIDSEHIGRGNVFYIGVLAVSILALSALGWWGIRHPELLDDSPEVVSWASRGGVNGSAIAVVIAFVVALAIPAAGEWPLLLLFLSGPIERATRRR